MERVGAAAFFAVLMMTSVGCGSRVAPGPDLALGEVASPGPTATSTLAASEVPSVTVAEGSAPPVPQGTAPSGTPHTPAARPSYGPKHNNGVVRIELSATCVKPGDLLIITLRTPPKAGLGMIIGYADNQPHGAMLTGESDTNGLYVWRVPVEPTVPDGEATVLVTSSGPNWEQEGGGTADAKFRVARGGC